MRYWSRAVALSALAATGCLPGSETAAPRGPAATSTTQPGEDLRLSTSRQSEELARARWAARAYCEMHGYGDVVALAGPPLLGPVVVAREGRPVTVYRWLGGGRGQDYVQVEVGGDSSDITVSGARGHDALPLWQPKRP